MAAAFAGVQMRYAGARYKRAIKARATDKQANCIDRTLQAAAESDAGPGRSRKRGSVVCANVQQASASAGQTGGATGDSKYRHSNHAASQ
jgi:hypothetical protein